jgi:predicted dehydrogenase
MGCGSIFERYVNGLRRFPEIEIVWCADLDEALARRRAKELSIPSAGSASAALSDGLGNASLVINLTPPSAHFEVSAALLSSGRHVYTEKPFATTLDDGKALIALAKARGLQLGGAPDWFLGRSCRTARHAVESGRIGEPIAASGFITHSRVERWHPNPGIFFAAGGGPVFDLGPYYVSALTDCLGPVSSVAALERMPQTTRLVTSPDRVVHAVTVAVPTHAVSLLEFRSGVVASLTMSFDAWERTMPFIEIYGTEGTLSLPMPHESDKAVRCKLHDDEEFSELELLGGEDYVRGLGVADMVRALGSGAEPRAGAARAYHVLEVLLAVDRASAEHAFVAVESSF